MSKLSLLLVAGALLCAPARGQERASGESLRQFCQNTRENEPARLFSADVKVPPLTYQEGALVTDLSKPFLIDDSERGVVEVFAGQPTEAAAAMGVPEGARLIKAQAQGKLTAKLVFAPQRGALTPTPCLVLGGNRVVRVRATHLWLTLIAGGQEQARLVTEEGQRLVPHGQPDVQLDLKGLIFDGDPLDLPEVKTAVQPAKQPALQCYQQALSAEGQDLAGTVIVGVTVDKDGHPSEGRVEVDSVGEAALSRCLREQVSGLRLPRLRRAGHLSVPFLLRQL